jgi:aryl-alcohol dehydrogenase-like predicted oxidoreductase
MGDRSPAPLRPSASSQVAAAAVHDTRRQWYFMAMEHRSLGSSGLKVPVLCLGAMTFGEADEKSFMHKVGCDEKTAFAIMSRALERGVGFVDTADVYGQDGLSERVVGAWMAESKTRDRVVVATKFRFRMGEGPNGTGASRYRIVRAVEESLRRLRTDRIDLYQVHMQDIDTPEEETLRALDDLVHAGKVLYLGASNYAAYRLADSAWIAKTEHLHRFVAIQMQYNLLVRDLEREHVPLCTRFGLGILPWSPLASGFLSGKYTRNQPPPAGARLEKWKERLAGCDNERGWRTLDAVMGIAKEKGTTANAVSLAWLLAKPAVASVIFGARSIQQLDDNLAAADVKLGLEDMKRLDEASAFELGYPYGFIANLQQRW